MSSRAASHAGSWYEANGARLGAQLQGWLDAVPADKAHGPARAIIAPHAGYSYSATTSAHAYKQVVPDGVTRVFVLGPSHHVYLDNCAVTGQETYATPLGALTIDAAVTQELLATGEFGVMSQACDEDEHSIEMHLPFIAQVMKDHEFTLVPILVGALSSRAEGRLGRLLAKFLADPCNLFVISSDFCHWGKRFSFTHLDPHCEQIYQGIEKLDHQGMALIAAKDTKGFAAYLKKFKNTICGRHAIAILLHAVAELDVEVDLQFLAYAQSSRCKRMSDSSVSYASASLVVRS